MSDQMTDDKRRDLSMHNDTMDNETAAFLFKISGLSALAHEATIQLRVNEPTPDGVTEVISVIRDLAQAALLRAGCA